MEPQSFNEEKGEEYMDIGNRLLCFPWSPFSLRVEAVGGKIGDYMSFESHR